MKTLITAPLGALLLVCAAPCQVDPAPASTAASTAFSIAFTAAPESFVLDAGSHEIPDLIDRVAGYLDYNILYNASELGNAGQIRITRRTEVDRKGCWELFGSLLYHKSLAVIALDPGKGFYEVIAMSGPRNREIVSGSRFVPPAELAAYANQKATPILTTVPLQNINATVATNALRPFFAAGGGNPGLSLGNVGNNSDILLQGFGPQVFAAYRLLQLVDVGDDSGAQVRVVRLEHAVAEELVARIEETLGSRGAMQTQMQGMAMMPLRAVAHPALNAVILSGSTTQIRDAIDLIASLDAPAIAASRVSEDVGRRLKQLEERLLKLEQAQRGPK